MWESFLSIIDSGEIWSILLKILIGLVLSGLTTLFGTVVATIISKNKESKIYKYADTLVDAAEQKYPNEGTKMGPQKLDYVMGQISIRFPKVRDNRYLYNVVEQAVFKLNDKKQQQKLIKEFEEKHGEGSFIGDDLSIDSDVGVISDSDKSTNTAVVEQVIQEDSGASDVSLTNQDETDSASSNTTTKSMGLRSF